jgi:RNA polymerase sigma-70 factor (ECF subfamily)
VWTVADDALIAGMADGDADATVAFVRRFQRRVFGLALTIVGDAAQADDVAQEAFTRAWRHAAAFDPRRGSVASWLLTITRNLAIDALRMRRATPTDPEVLVGMGLVDLTSGPGEAAVTGDEVDALKVALRSLPVDQRRAVVLAAIGGRTAQEVSEIEGIPLGTAKTRIRTALIRLRHTLVPAPETER